MAKVYITDSTFESNAIAEKTLGLAGHSCTFLNTKDVEALAAGAADGDALLVQFAPITERLLEALPKLKVMVRYGVGYDNFDLAAARRLGVIACYCPGYCIDEVADHTLAMLLAAARRLVQLANRTGAGQWGVSAGLGPIVSLRGKVLGLIGFGAIAREVAARAHAFGLRVLASDPALTDAAALDCRVTRAPLDLILAEADFISLHCPLTEKTRHIIDAGALAQMKPGAIVINNGRGGLIDEEALRVALLEERIAYAALDVLSNEPPAATYPLLGLPNVLITPHIASVSQLSSARLQQMAVDEVVRVLAGEPPLHPIVSEAA